MLLGVSSLSELPLSTQPANAAVTPTDLIATTRLMLTGMGF